MPLIASTMMRTGRRSGPPISLRNTAHRKPSGTDNSMARPTCSSVPTMAWAAPPEVADDNGPVIS